MAGTIVDALRGALGSDKVLTDDATRDARRHDHWFASQLDDAQDRAPARPACVVRPASVADVVAVVNRCRDSGAPLIPFGLGSGVVGGVVTSAEAVLLDLGELASVREIDAHNLVAGFDAGVRGSDAEAAVAEQGLTIGHFPQSIGVSTVGGWVATRAAGQFSTGYGNIEDIVLDIEAVLPNGEVLQTQHTPRASSGPDLRHLVLGSEGTLGVITGVTFSVRRAAEKQSASAFYVKSMPAGFELQREIVQRGWLPVVMRQYDSTETQRMFSGQARGADGLLLLVHEGPAARVDAEVAEVAAIANERGSDPAPMAAVEHWLEERNHVPTFKAFIDNGVIVDTIEIAAVWDRIEAIYDRALAALQEVPGILTASAHSSHCYRSGLNLYFTFAAHPKERAEMKSTYEECWRRVVQATVDEGGGISHHHGIGRVRRNWLTKEIGTTGLSALRAVKRALDPTGFMNPGVLFPPE